MGLHGTDQNSFGGGACCRRDVIIENIAGTGVPLVATSPANKLEGTNK